MTNIRQADDDQAFFRLFGEPITQPIFSIAEKNSAVFKQFSIGCSSVEYSAFCVLAEG